MEIKELQTKAIELNEKLLEEWKLKEIMKIEQERQRLEDYYKEQFKELDDRIKKIKDTNVVPKKENDNTDLSFDINNGWVLCSSRSNN